MGSNNKKYTQEEFVFKLKQIQPDVSVLGTYNGTHTPILLYCNKHNTEFYQRPSKALIGQCGCNICAVKKGKRYKKTHEQFLLEMSEKNSQVKVLSQYIGDHIQVKCECVNCGEKWDATPNNLLKGKGCKKCGHKNSTKKRTKTHEDFVKELQLITDTIIPLEEYQQALTKIKFQCLECGRIWDIEPHSILQGKGCLCGNASYGEKNITEYLTNNNIEFVPQKKFDNLLGVGGRQLSYDFYLPAYNILIEYQGEFHDGTARNQTEIEYLKQQEHDKRKKEYSDKHNIQLLEIWYYEQDKMIEILNNTLYNPVTTKVI